MTGSTVNVNIIKSDTDLTIDNNAIINGSINSTSIDTTNIDSDGIINLTNSTTTSNLSDTVNASLNISGDTLLNNIYFNQSNGFPTNLSQRSPGTKITLYSDIENSLGESSIGNSDDTVWISSNIFQCYISGIKKLDVSINDFSITTTNTNMLKSRINDTTDSSSLTDINSSLIVEGGGVIKKNLFIGGNLNVSGNFEPPNISVSGSFQAGINTPVINTTNGSNVSSINIINSRTFTNGDYIDYYICFQISVIADFTPSSFNFDIQKTNNFTDESQFILHGINGNNGSTRLYDLKSDIINNTKIITSSFTSNTTNNHIIWLNFSILNT